MHYLNHSPYISLLFSSIHATSFIHSLTQPYCTISHFEMNPCNMAVNFTCTYCAKEQRLGARWAPVLPTCTAEYSAPTNAPGCRCSLTNSPPSANTAPVCRDEAVQMPLRPRKNRRAKRRKSKQSDSGMTNGEKSRDSTAAPAGDEAKVESEHCNAMFATTRLFGEDLGS